MTKSTSQSVDLYAPLFADSGIGTAISSALVQHIDDYALDCETHDHEPTDFEQLLLEDFVNGGFSEESVVGPLRQLQDETIRLLTAFQGFLAQVGAPADGGWDDLDDMDQVSIKLRVGGIREARQIVGLDHG